jgi:hypothetical protein
MTDVAELSWFILLTFPNGGSTPIAKLLLTARNTVALTPTAEGQWLSPEMSAPGGRWNPDAVLDYADIRSRWMKAVKKARAKIEQKKGHVLVIEKSPPNMCRYKDILAMLTGMPVYVAVMTRDPYATCASWHFRYGRDDIGRNWGWPSHEPTDDDSYFEALAETWLVRARYLESARSTAIAWFKYEDFARAPGEIVSLLSSSVPELALADPHAAVVVKDYPAQTIRDMNQEKLSQLTSGQTAAITRRLARDADLVSRLGYHVAEAA